MNIYAQSKRIPAKEGGFTAFYSVVGHQAVRPLFGPVRFCASADYPAFGCAISSSYRPLYKPVQFPTSENGLWSLDACVKMFLYILLLTLHFIVAYLWVERLRRLALVQGLVALDVVLQAEPLGGRKTSN
jgi:hypothetical protein